jgi:uncharacterized protein YbjT (DUF2867 family)
MIVVTTPTGQIGSQLIKYLLAANQALRVVVRHEESLPAELRAKVEIVEGSHGDAALVRRAFLGADAVFWLVPPDPAASSVEAAYVDFTRPAVEALRNADVKHVVGVSSLGRGKPQAEHAGNITASLAMDDLIASAVPNYRALANVAFMDNILRQVPSIKEHGVFYSPAPGDLKIGAVATRDIATVAAELLIDRSWRGRSDVPLLGPEDLSFNDMARIVSDVTGKVVRFEAMPDEVLKSGMLARGRSEAMAQATIDMMKAVREGIYSNEMRTAAASTPTTFRRWCQEVLRPAVTG